MICLDRETKMDIFSTHLRGLSYERMAERFGLSSSTLQRKYILIEGEIKNSFVSIESDQGESIVKSVLSLALVGQMSSRAIEEYLRITDGIKLSHDTILSILQLASGVAKQLNASLLYLNNVKTASFDEIFQSSQPILNFVDNHSGVTQLVAVDNRSGDEWAKFLTDLQAKGLDPETAISDGGTGLKKGIKDAKMVARLVLDLFHFLHKLSLAKDKAEAACYALMYACEKSTLSQEEYQKITDKMNAAIDSFDKIEGLYKQIKLHMRLAFPNQNQYISSEVLLGELDLMQTLLEQFIQFSSHKKITDAKNYIKNNKQELTTYKNSIEKDVQGTFSTETQFVLNHILPIIEYFDHYERSYEDKKRQSYWADQIRESISDALECVSREAFDNMLNTVTKIVEKYARANSLVENLNNQIRRYLDTYKSIPVWFCDLFSFYWNFRKFKRGKRAGYAPFELLTNTKLKKNWLEMLLEKFPYHKLNLSNKVLH